MIRTSLRERAAEQRVAMVLALLESTLDELEETVQRIEDKRRRGFPTDDR